MHLKLRALFLPHDSAQYNSESLSEIGQALVVLLKQDQSKGIAPKWNEFGRYKIKGTV